MKVTDTYLAEITDFGLDGKGFSKEAMQSASEINISGLPPKISGIIKPEP